jgi:hypothetical protein
MTQEQLKESMERANEERKREQEERKHTSEQLSVAMKKVGLGDGGRR